MTRVVSSPLPHSEPVSISALGVEGQPVGRNRASSVGGPGRSVSPRRDWAFTWRITHRSETPPNGVPTSWWGARETESRPWVQRRQKSIPVEHSEGYQRTGRHVAEAVVNVLGTTAYVAHEALVLGGELLVFAPFPGLDLAARVLLEIWDALQMVDVNRSACLRLTERCATILYSVREEIADAGDQVGEELHHPIERLVESFHDVYQFLQRQNHRPFIKRYLKREEIQRALGVCDNSLNDALNMFNLSIQIRILKQVVRAEQARQVDTAALIETVMRNQQGSPLPAPTANALQLTGTESAVIAAITSVEQLMSASPEQIRETLQAIASRQNERDAAVDTADLRGLMREALQANSDVEMLRVLQVGRDEMPEAVKALQRALESEVDREFDAAEAEAEDLVLVTSVSSELATAGTEGGANLTRSTTLASVESRKTTSDGSAASRRTPRDTLDREFIETGIEALRRLSTVEMALPSWTITRYEVEAEQKIGIGFFSDVYKGTWRERTVAIKVLAETTPRKLFIHEATIWKELQHPNVLELLGASSASSDAPWFFVSPYYKNGSIVPYLKGLPTLEAADPLRMIHEIANGMAYLHGKEVLHGDLKGANVLVDDRGHCIISDFGQSEMKSEAYRISGEPLPHGTLRWQAPELMSGQSGLTQQVDVYAFAMCCIEVLVKGSIPWPYADDDAVRHFVLKENMRPEIPLIQQQWTPHLSEIIKRCWDRIPASRPSFDTLVHDLQQLRHHFGLDAKESPLPTHLQVPKDPHRASPSMLPVPLPPLPPDTTATFVDEPSISVSSSYETAHGDSESFRSSPVPHESEVGPEHDPFIHSPPTLSRTSSYSETADSRSDSGVLLDPPGYQSPPPADQRQADIRNERRYRMLVQHEFHPSLTLPLWTPCQVMLGSVGYLSKPAGEFVTLFNAFKPTESSGGLTGSIAALEDIGRVTTGIQRQGKRSVAQRGMDMLQSWLNSKNNTGSTTNIRRRYSSPLRQSHKTAHLFTESTVYRYVEDLAIPKRWFKANVDSILKVYGDEHPITREDLFLVIGTLEAQDYALYVSHSHPDGQLNFSVHSAARAGQPWGHFSTSTDLSSSLLGGPVYSDEPIGGQLSAQKVSSVGRGGRWDSVLLARLRFKTDSPEPTSQ